MNKQKFDEDEILREQIADNYPVPQVNYFQVTQDSSQSNKFAITQYIKKPINGSVELFCEGDISVGIRSEKQAQKIVDFLNAHYPNFVTIG